MSWTVSYPCGGETTRNMDSFEDCLDAIQNRFRSRVQTINWRRPMRSHAASSMAKWEFYDEGSGDVVALIYWDE